MSKPTKQRQADFRARQRAAGLVLVQYWVDSAHRAKLDDYVRALNKKSDKSKSD